MEFYRKDPVFQQHIPLSHTISNISEVSGEVIVTHSDYAQRLVTRFQKKTFKHKKPELQFLSQSNPFASAWSEGADFAEKESEEKTTEVVINLDVIQDLVQGVLKLKPNSKEATEALQFLAETLEKTPPEKDDLSLWKESYSEGWENLSRYQGEILRSVLGWSPEEMKENGSSIKVRVEIFNNKKVHRFRYMRFSDRSCHIYNLTEAVIQALQGLHGYQTLGEELGHLNLVNKLTGSPERRQDRRLKIKEERSQALRTGVKGLADSLHELEEEHAINVWNHYRGLLEAVEQTTELRKPVQEIRRQLSRKAKPFFE